MKIESKTGTKKPLYALGASVLAATVIMAGCSKEEPIQYAGETQTAPTSDIELASETTLPTTNYYVSNAYREIAFGRTTFTPEEALKWAKSHDIPVFEDGICTAGREAWEIFCEDARPGFDAEIVCAYYYSADEENPASLYFYLIRYNNDIFKVESKSCTDEYLEADSQFGYLNHYTGENPEGAEYDCYDFYVLVDDSSVTWEDIMEGMFSSDSSKQIDHRVVFSDYYNIENTNETIDPSEETEEPSESEEI